MKFYRDERGSVGILFGLTTILVTGIVGMAVDVGRALKTSTQLQSALDSAVLAASNQPVETKASVAQSYFTANFMDRFGSGATIPQFTTAADGSVAGQVTAFVDTTFGKIVGIETLTVVASSSAKPTTSTTETSTTTVETSVRGATPCIHVQDQNNTSFTLDSNSKLDESKCEVHVRSNSSYAMYAVSNSQTTFKKILIKGGTSSAGGITIVDSPFVVQTNAAVVGDPYSSAIADVIRRVTVGNCTSVNTDKTWTGNVAPGTYCGKTEFKNATFAKGVYVVTDKSGSAGGELKLSGSLNGSAGVSFFLQGNKTKITGYNPSEGSVLKAPTDGYTKGLLFFEASNRGITSDVTISSCNKQSWTGIVYLPSVNLKLDSLSEWPVLNVGMVVNQLTMKSLSSIVNPYLWTPYGWETPIYLPDEKKLVSTSTTTTVDKSKFLLK